MIPKVLLTIIMTSFLFSSPLWAPPGKKENGQNDDQSVTLPKKPNLQSRVEGLPNDLQAKIASFCPKEFEETNKTFQKMSHNSTLWIMLIKRAEGSFEGVKTARDEFFDLGPRAHLLYADFLAEQRGNKKCNKKNAGRYYNRVLDTYPSSDFIDLKIQAQIGICVLDLWPYNDSFRIERLQCLLQSASRYPSIPPEKQARAQLCLALGRHHFLRDNSFSMSIERAYEIFDDVSQNPETSPKDRARAKLWKATLWLGFRRTAPIEAHVAHGLFVEVSQDPTAAPEDRDSAEWHKDHPHLHPPYFNPAPPPEPQ